VLSNFFDARIVRMMSSFENLEDSPIEVELQRFIYRHGLYGMVGPYSLEWLPYPEFSPRVVQARHIEAPNGCTYVISLQEDLYGRFVTFTRFKLGPFFRKTRKYSHGITLSPRYPSKTPWQLDWCSGMAMLALELEVAFRAAAAGFPVGVHR
jgi:hypothetical protein